MYQLAGASQDKNEQFKDNLDKIRQLQVSRNAYKNQVADQANGVHISQVVTLLKLMQPRIVVAHTEQYLMHLKIPLLTRDFTLTSAQGI